MEEGHVDEIMYLAAACNRWRHTQDPRDDEITRLAAACEWRRRRLQVRRDDGRWSNLPKDVISKVICHLPLLNDNLRLRFAAVCRNWHAVERLHLPYSLPKLCLALPDGSFFTVQPGSSSILEPRDNLSRRPYRGASSSQLLYDTKDCSVYCLVNPFTLRKRRLPIPSRIPVHEDDELVPEELYWSKEIPVQKLVVCPDGLVAAIIGHKRSARVALCEPEGAGLWSLSAGDRWRSYADMVVFDGKLYALTNDLDLLTLKVDHDEESSQPRISCVERVIEGAGFQYDIQEYTRMHYLVVRPRGRGLLMVSKVMLEYSSITYEFAVFQADLRLSRWVRIDSFGGDEAVFVGRLCSRAVLADQHWVRGDLIFFLDDFTGMDGPGQRLCRDGWANVYDMKVGSVRELIPRNPYWDGLLMRQSTQDKVVPATWLFSEDINTEL